MSRARPKSAATPSTPLPSKRVGGLGQRPVELDRLRKPFILARTRMWWIVIDNAGRWACAHDLSADAIATLLAECRAAELAHALPPATAALWGR